MTLNGDEVAAASVLETAASQDAKHCKQSDCSGERSVDKQRIQSPDEKSRGAVG